MTFLLTYLLIVYFTLSYGICYTFYHKAKQYNDLKSYIIWLYLIYLFIYGPAMLAWDYINYKVFASDKG